MLAAYFTDIKKLELREVPIPEIGEGEALVKAIACGFCGSDKHDFLHPPPSPRIPGHEFSGIVEKISGDSLFSVGDEVIVDPIMRCGECEACREGRDNFCDNMAVIGCQTDGGFAQFVKVPAGNLHPKPAHLSFEEATFADPLAVALHALSFVRPLEGKNCLVLGAGTIGLLTAQILKREKAEKVFLVDIEESHLKTAQKIGDFISINANSPQDWQNLNPTPIDLSIELAGGEAPTLNQALAMTRKGGDILLVAQRPKPPTIDYQVALFKELRLQGVFGQTKQDFQEAIALLKEGKIKAKPLITHIFPLDEIERALQHLFQPQAIKVLVKPWEIE